jgi:hypothetical protein
VIPIIDIYYGLRMNLGNGVTSLAQMNLRICYRAGIIPNGFPQRYFLPGFEKAVF